MDDVRAVGRSGEERSVAAGGVCAGRWKEAPEKRVGGLSDRRTKKNRLDQSEIRIASHVGNYPGPLH